MTWKKTSFERKKLFDEGWATPVTKLAKAYGLSNVGLRKICVALEVPLPPRGYWARERPDRAGRVFRAPPTASATGAPCFRTGLRQDPCQTCQQRYRRAQRLATTAFRRSRRRAALARSAPGGRRCLASTLFAPRQPCGARSLRRAFVYITDRAYEVLNASARVQMADLTPALFKTVSDPGPRLCKTDDGKSSRGISVFRHYI